MPRQNTRFRCPVVNQKTIIRHCYCPPLEFVWIEYDGEWCLNQVGRGGFIQETKTISFGASNRINSDGESRGIGYVHSPASSRGTGFFVLGLASLSHHNLEDTCRGHFRFIALPCGPGNIELVIMELSKHPVAVSSLSNCLNWQTDNSNQARVRACWLHDVPCMNLSNRLNPWRSLYPRYKPSQINQLGQSQRGDDTIFCWIRKGRGQYWELISMRRRHVSLSGVESQQFTFGAWACWSSWSPRWFKENWQKTGGTKTLSSQILWQGFGFDGRETWVKEIKKSRIRVEEQRINSFEAKIL